MNRVLCAFKGKNDTRPPFWIMRQAGRYLPEYREVRESCNGFLDLCYTPEKAIEVTLQPLRRFDMDAAIIFSDILVVPDAMGVGVRFEKGEGPLLEEVTDASALKELSLEHLAPVYEVIRGTRKALAEDKALIGFSGGVWTLLCYLLQGRGDKTFEKARQKLYTDPALVSALTEKLTEAVARHLVQQAKAGASVLQIFDSWAAFVPATHREVLILEPTRRIVAAVKSECPSAPVIGFPRGLASGYGAYVKATGVDGISVDCTVNLSRLREELGKKVVIQGNLDPLLLASDKAGTMKQAQEIMETMRGTPFIFNLGHGVLPPTPVENVQALAETIRNFR